MKCVFSAFPKALLWLFMLYWALLCGIVCLANPPKATLLALAALPVLVCVGQGLTAWEKRKPKLFWAAFAVLAAVFFAAAALYALEARIRLPSDTDILYASVGDLLRDGVLNETNPNMELYYPGMGLVTNADYFCMYYNNIAALLMLFAAYRLMPGYIPGTAQGQTPALLLAVLCMAVTVLLLCAAVYMLTRRGSAVMLTLLLCCVFQPFYFGLVNFYTDILMLPFAVGGAAALGAAYVSGRRRWLCLAGLVWAFGVCVKVSTGILVIAAVPAVLLRPHPPAQRLRNLAALLLPFAAGLLLFKLWRAGCGWFDFTRAQELAMPWQVWLCFGAQGTGYRYDEALLAISAAPEQRSAVMWQRLREIYAGYTVPQLLQMEAEKIRTVWNDGRYETAVYAMWPQGETWTAIFTQPGQPLYPVLWWAGQLQMLVLYFTALASGAAMLRRKQPDPAVWYILLSVLGVAAYLTLFESAARRALPAAVLLLPLCGMVCTAPGARTLVHRILSRIFKSKRSIYG